jgi:hypothetical protein
LLARAAGEKHLQLLTRKREQAEYTNHASHALLINSNSSPLATFLKQAIIASITRISVSLFSSNPPPASASTKRPPAKMENEIQDDDPSAYSAMISNEVRSLHFLSSLHEGRG